MNPITRIESSPPRFLAHDPALDIIRGLQTPLAVVRPAMAATGSIASDLALGSLREVGAVLDIASAHGWLANPAPLDRERDRLCGMIYGLQRRR